LFSAKNFNSCSSAILTHTLLPINTASIALFHVLISVFAAFCLPGAMRHSSKITADARHRALVAAKRSEDGRYGVASRHRVGLEAVGGFYPSHADYRDGVFPVRG
jgi:hypothetical protein